MEKNYPASITRHDAFRSLSEKFLRRKLECRIARMDGKGKVPNRARSLSGAEEKILWESVHLGCNSSRSPIQTVWTNNCLNFGMRGGEEHRSLKI